MNNGIDEFTAILEDFMSQIREKIKEVSDGKSIKDSVLGFLHAVDWTEPWLIGIVIFHLSFLLVVILTRNRETLQIVLFFFSGFAVFLAEHLNSFASKHWKKFAAQPYFDKNGNFMATVWSGPFIIVNMVALINILRSLFKLMIKWKRAELKHKARMARRKVE